MTSPYALMKLEIRAKIFSINVRSSVSTIYSLHSAQLHTIGLFSLLNVQLIPELKNFSICVAFSFVPTTCTISILLASGPALMTYTGICLTYFPESLL